MIYKFLEYYNSEQDKFKPLNSFSLKDTLNDKIWDSNEVLKEHIREQLLEIGNDLFKSLELDFDYDDIILTGSLANFNYSEYSDFDLHVVFDYTKLNKDFELVKKYTDAIRFNWNSLHQIEIEGYEVEVYLQDTNEQHLSSGQYSISNNLWVIKPVKEHFEVDENSIKLKATTIMEMIDDVETDYEIEADYEIIITKIKRIFKKILDARKAGLNRDGELSVENLAFKLLRRNGYITKIIDMRHNAYDRKFK